jgi:hypothetical protein
LNLRKNCEDWCGLTTNSFRRFLGIKTDGNGRVALSPVFIAVFFLLVAGGVGYTGIQKLVNTSGYMMETSNRQEHKPELHAVIDGV